MNWAYLLVFNEKLGARKAVIEFLNTLPEVTYWYACFPNSIFLTSNVTAGSLAEKIKAEFGTDNQQRFFITEVSPDKQGWMPKQAWHLINNPESPHMPKP